MSQLFTRRIVLFDSLSANSSNFTSVDAFVGDYRSVVASVATSDAAASRMTFEGSNDDGFNTSIVTRSALTTTTVPGVFAFEPGFRWIRAIRSSLDSQGQVFLHLKS